MRRRPGAGLVVGKVILTLAGVWTTGGAFAFDWNETHLYNPAWPPHAKFHDAQTLSLAAATSGLAAWQLWKAGPDSRSRLNWAVLFDLLFLATQAPAILFPNTAWADPDQPRQPTVRAGIPINQLTIQMATVGPLVLTGYLIARRSLPR